MTDLLNLSTAKLRRIVALKQQIEKLSAKLQTLAGGSAASAAKPGRKKWKMSLAARRKIAAAAKARWAKVRTAGKPARKKRTMSAAGRAKISAAAKARWAKVRAAKNK
jgi:hypothetical protein